MTPEAREKLKKELLRLSHSGRNAVPKTQLRNCISPVLAFDGNFTRTKSAQQAHAELSLRELQLWARLKRRLKRGPRMTRKQRAEYLRRLAREMGIAK